MSASPTGLSPSLTDLSRSFGSPVVIYRRSSTPSVRRPSVWPLPSSLATTKGIEFSFFSSGYLDVSVPRVPFLKLWIHLRIHDSSPCGFPHSDICGSRLICSSPQLFAACRVLLRLLMPRHSPYALFSLNFMSFANLFLRSKCFRDSFKSLS